MEKKIKTYQGEQVDVTYDVKRCIHAAECVNRLNSVFNTDKRPWIQPDEASVDALTETIQHCPTGALHYERKDGGPSEATPDENTIQLVADGPLYVRGDVTIASMDDDVLLTDTRVALCRCGDSQNKPLCDNTHQSTDFKAAGDYGAAMSSDEAASGDLTVKGAPDGPLLLTGKFRLLNDSGETVFAGEKAALCRCGGSMNKPFCDGTHAKIGFEAD